MSTLATRIGQEIKTVRTEVGDIATELEMQEGTSTDIKRMSPALVKAAVDMKADGFVPLFEKKLFGGI